MQTARPGGGAHETGHDALAKPHRYVFAVPPAEELFCHEHEAQTRLVLGAKLAQLKKIEFRGIWQAGAPPDCAAYFVPAETLLSEEAARLGIRGEDDLFGGVVPRAFVGTKTIVHPLIGRDAEAPEGWSHQLGERIAGVTLRGLSAFSVANAAEAGRRLLRSGPVRLKPATGVGGHGQVRIAAEDDLARALARQDQAEIARLGIVLEEDLRSSSTFSIGRLRVGALEISYFGTQEMTANNRGQETYGGSTLNVVRGGFDALLASNPPADAVAAIRMAQAFENAAAECYPGFYASRRNYDVIDGIDWNGERRRGVLEQSWRIGGASTAELLAMEKLRSDPDRQSITVASVERFGTIGELPPGALLAFRGKDQDDGLLLKYAVEK